MSGKRSPSSPYGKSTKLPSFDCRKRLVTFAMDVMTRFCFLAFLVNGPQQVLLIKHTVSIWVMPREISLCLTWRRTRKERLVRIQYLRGDYFCVGWKEFKPCSIEFWRCLGVSFAAVIRIRGKKLIVFFFSDWVNQHDLSEKCFSHTVGVSCTVVVRDVVIVLRVVWLGSESYNRWNYF